MAREKVGALLLLMFSVAYGYLATEIPLSFLAQQDVFTSRTMPYALTVCGVLLSLGIILSKTVDPQGKETLGDATAGMDWKTAALLVGTMVGYGLVMKWIGFVLASIVFLMIGFRILGEKSIKKSLMAAVPLVLGLWGIMAMLLDVYIAPGEIFYILGVIE